MNIISKLVLASLGSFVLLGFNVLEAKEILIFGNGYKPPKKFLDINGKPSGILVEIMRYVDKQLPDVEFVYKLSPWKRAYHNAEQGKGGVIGFSKNDERLKRYDYSDAMYYDELVLVVKKGHEFEYNTIKDLQDKRVGFIRGATFGQEFEDAKNSIFMPSEDNEGVQRLKKLLYDRIDVALVGGGKYGVNVMINKDSELIMKKDGFVILPTPFIKDSNHLGFLKSMNMKEFLVDFNRVLQEAKEDGTIERIIERYSRKF